jgi:hypothetical protein
MKYVRQFGSIWELPEQKFKSSKKENRKGRAKKLDGYLNGNLPKTFIQKD